VSLGIALNKVVYKFKTIGLSFSDSEEERSRLFLTNGLALITCLPPIFYGIVFTILGFYSLILLNTIFAGLFLLTLLFNKYRLRYMAKLCLIGTLCLAIFSYSLILGISSGIYLVTFAVSCIGLVLFPTYSHIGKVISLGIPVLTIISVFYLEQFDLFRIHSFQQYANIIFILSVLTTFTIIFFVLRFFMVLNDAYNLKVAKINTQLEIQNTSLQTAYTELQTQQKLLEKTWHDTVYAQLTRTIAHELKNPLFEFGMVIAALRESLDDRETSLMFIDSLGTTIQELMELLHAMLESGGANVGEPKEMNISDVMRRVLILAEGSLKKRNIRLHKDYAPLPTIMGDPKAYLMVFSNLIVNAMEAMSDDDGPGGDLTVRLRHQTEHPKGQYNICIEIEDSGVGIAKDRQATLFRGGQSSKNIDERQRGIGLALVWKLIHQMGGEITVHSDPEMKPGTMFRIVV
jgi:signal transduction histidine kinase